MRALQVKKYLQSPLDLTETSVPDPKPSPTQYLIAIRAISLNFLDTLQIQGKYQDQPAFPWIAGNEFAGVILSAPASTSTSDPASHPPKFKPGDRVFGSAQGACATKLCADEILLRGVPDGWSCEDAAGLYITAATGYAGLVTRANIKPGEYVLVHAAAGGTGLAAIQVAKAHGATVIATAGTEAKLEIARSFGADHCILYTDKTWADQVKSLTPHGRGVDIVFDPVGLINQSLRCIGWSGRIVVVGFAAGKIERVAANRVLLKNISIMGIFWGGLVMTEPHTAEEVWKGVEEMISNGTFRPTRFDERKFEGLGDVAEALRSLAERETWGKVVVAVPQAWKANL